MTDNRLHVKFEYAEADQEGEIQETLEHLFSDELGARPYETYSGGELPHRFASASPYPHYGKRAGAPLPT
jgi:hypothetical protein